MSLALKAEPDWAGAAEALVAGLQAQSELDDRVEVIERCRTELGDQVYPAFIKLLAAVARFGDEPARRLTAEALAHALTTARLPAARVPAWGGAQGAGTPLVFGGGLLGALRSVGPIEFLCLWLERDLDNERLDADTFRTALTWLLVLFSASPQASRLYVAKLRADVKDAIEGLHTRASRRLISALADAWAAGEAPQAVARRCADLALADRAAHRWGPAPV